MTDREIQAKLQELRSTIDNLDAAITHMLAERFRCTHRIGILKARHNLSAHDPEREAFQSRRLRQLSEAAGLDPEFIVEYLKLIFPEVIRQHEEIARTLPQ